MHVEYYKMMKSNNIKEKSTILKIFFYLSFYFFYAKNVPNRPKLMIILIDIADNCLKYLKSMIDLKECYITIVKN